MAAIDLLGRRWVMRILWELNGGPLGFRSLQSACDGMSSSVLAARLADLTSTKIVTVVEQGAYALTDLGRGLTASMLPLFIWSEQWARALDADSDA
jgi:DNA-binding HxlR family transcriptional regulator